MPEQTNNELIQYFCQELPDRHNLLAWRTIWYRSGEIFKHPEGMMYQILAFERTEVLWLCHVMVIGVN